MEGNRIRTFTHELKDLTIRPLHTHTPSRSISSFYDLQWFNRVWSALSMMCIHLRARAGLPESRKKIRWAREHTPTSCLVDDVKSAPSESVPGQEAGWLELAAARNVEYFGYQKNDEYIVCRLLKWCGEINPAHPARARNIVRDVTDVWRIMWYLRNLGWARIVLICRRGTCCRLCRLSFRPLRLSFCLQKQ